MADRSRRTGTLILICPDQKGLVARISGFLFENGSNILHADQHENEQARSFLMRIEWELEGSDLNPSNFRAKFEPLAQELRLKWKIAFSEVKPRVGILVSHWDHCLADLLYRNQMGELHCEIALVISNHPQARELVEFYKIPFYWIPVQIGARQVAEKLQLELLREKQVELVILARYMQILSPEFVQSYEHQIINIHHSFLPAFVGAKPYHQAFARGVKVIGATSHYVTPDLDEGPIIHQDVISISHRDQVADLIRKGRDLERVVLSQAVKWHLENRIVTDETKTVIFD